MQINRLFQIVYILLENKTVTAKELSERFEVSRRTIYRDVEILSEAGIPVYMNKGKGGGISLLPNFVLNKTVLTDEEKNDVLSSLKAFAVVHPSSEKDSTFDKLSSLLGKPQSQWIEVNFNSWVNYKNETDVFNVLKDAVQQNIEVEFDYTSSKGEIMRRNVLPLKLVFKSQAWYLYGFCKTRNDVRFFKLRRIENIKLSENHFSMKAPESIFHENEFTFKGTIEACFRISPKMSFRVIDEFKEYYIDEKGYYICKALLPDEISICCYALSYGELCEILSPQSSREKLIKVLNNTLNLYK